MVALALPIGWGGGVDLACRTPEEEVAALRHELAAVRAQLGAAAVGIEHLRAQLAALRRQRYGPSSERLDADIAQLELRLEDLEGNEAERRAAVPDPAAPMGSPKPRQKTVRRPLPDHLPRETVVHEPAAVCGGCDRAKLARRGEDVTASGGSAAGCFAVGSPGGDSAGEGACPAQGDPPCPAPLRLPRVRGGVPGPGA